MSTPERRRVLFVRPLYLVALVWVVFRKAPIRVALPRGDRSKPGQRGEFSPACFYYDVSDATLEAFIMTYQFALGRSVEFTKEPRAEEYATAAEEVILSMSDIRRTDGVAAALRYYVSREGASQSPWVDPRVKELTDGLMVEIDRLWKQATTERKNKHEQNYDVHDCGGHGGEYAGGSEGGAD